METTLARLMEMAQEHGKATAGEWSAFHTFCDDGEMGGEWCVLIDCGPRMVAIVEVETGAVDFCHSCESGHLPALAEIVGRDLADEFI